MRKKVLIFILVVLGIIGVIACFCIWGLVSYWKMIPTITMKENVVIEEGDTIQLDDVAIVSDNMEEYRISAIWENGKEEGISGDEEHHSIIIENGKGDLVVTITAAGANKEFVSESVLVKVE